MFNYMTPVMLTDSTGYWFGFDDIFTGPVDEIIVLGLLALAVYIGIPGSDELLDSTIGVIDNVLNSANNISKKIRKYRTNVAVILSTLVISNISKLNQYDKHHIVAQKDPRAGMSRMVLLMSGIGINSADNLVAVRKPIHWVMHTNEYHAAVTITLWGAYSAGGTVGVKMSLKALNIIIEGGNGIFGN
jgi:hypothetical protein